MRGCLEGKDARLTISLGSSARLKSCGGSAGQVMNFHGPRRIIINGDTVPSPQYSANTVSEPPSRCSRCGSRDDPSIGSPGHSLTFTKSTKVGRISKVETFCDTW